MTTKDEPENCEHPRVLRRALEEHERMKGEIDQLKGRDGEWPHSERRKYGGLTDEQVEQIMEALLAKIYEDIGRSVVRKFLWIGGAVLSAVFAWGVATGFITPPKP